MSIDLGGVRRACCVGVGDTMFEAGIITEKGIDMSDHGKRDSQKATKKQALLTPKEKRKLKKAKKAKKDV
jgi:hypothetical protein